MEWFQYVIFGGIVLFLIQRFLPTKGLTNLSAEEVAKMLISPKDHIFIDVREVNEYKRGHIRGFKNIPLSQLSNRLPDIQPGRSIILTCQSGMRSKRAAKILQKNGFNQISHLKTGVMGWNQKLVN